MEQEEYVRSRWANIGEYDYGHPPTGGIAGSCYLWLADIGKEFNADSYYRLWTEAYAFTLERERQIKEVEYEISLQELISSTHENAEWKNPHDHREDGDALLRTLARLQSTLADLQRGMKIEAPNE